MDREVRKRLPALSDAAKRKGEETTAALVLKRGVAVTGTVIEEGTRRPVAGARISAYRPAGFGGFARRRAGVLRKVVIPMLMPYGAAALRVSYGVCWKIALISELFGARSGLGYLMLQAQAVGDITSVLATCLTIVMLFALGDGLLINPITRNVRRDLAAKEL